MPNSRWFIVACVTTIENRICIVFNRVASYQTSVCMKNVMLLDFRKQMLCDDVLTFIIIAEILKHQNISNTRVTECKRKIWGLDHSKGVCLSFKICIMETYIHINNVIYVSVFIYMSVKHISHLRLPGSPCWDSDPRGNPLSVWTLRRGQPAGLHQISTWSLLIFVSI